MFKKYLTLFWAIVALGAGGQSFAVEPSEISLSVSKSPLPRSKTGSNVYIIYRDDIARSGSVNLAELLEDIPGINIIRNGGEGSVTQVKLRGQKAGRYLKVLVDGIDVSDPSSIDRILDFADFDSANIERIELVTGSNASIHGAGAVAGVLIISTLPQQSRVSYRSGSYGTQQSAIALAHRGDGYRVFATYGFFNAEGFNSTEPAPNISGDLDGHQRTTTTAGFELAATDWLTFAGVFSKGDSVTRIDGGLTDYSPGDDISEISYERGKLGFTSKLGTTTHALDFTTLATTRYVSTTNTHDENSIGNDLTFVYSGIRRQLSYNFKWQPLSWLMTLAGLDYTYAYSPELLELRTDFPSATQPILPSGSVRSAHSTTTFFELIGAINENFHFSLAERVSYFSQYGLTSSTQLSLAYDIFKDSTYRFSAGQGTVQPTFYHLANLKPEVDSLIPEQSFSIETGFETALFDFWYLRLTGYAQLIYDQIVFPDAPLELESGYEQSSGLSTYFGVDFLTEATFNKLQATFDLAYLHARDPNGEVIDHVPALQTNLKFAYVDNKWGTFTTTIRHTSSTIETIKNFNPPPSSFIVTNPTHILWNASYSYPLLEKMRFFFELRNITNTAYTNANGYNQPKFNYRFGVSTQH